MPEEARESVGELLSLDAAKSATGTLLTDLYGLVKKSAVNEFRKWRIRGGAATLHRHLQRYRMVKTILNLERAQDLATFYYPTKVSILNSKGFTQRIPISSTADLPARGNVLIVGYVGQGKSIFLRYLAAREIVNGNGAIPIFVEMRNIRNRSIRSFLIEELGSLSLEMDSGLFDYFATERAIYVFS